MRHALLFLLLPTPAVAEDCGAIFASLQALATAPGYRATLVTADAPLMRSVMIGDMAYINPGDGWSKIPLPPGGRAGLIAAFVPAAEALRDCQRLPDATLDGVPLAVWSFRAPVPEGLPQLPGAEAVQQIWIGADGLPRRSTTAGVEMTLSYDNLTPPM